MTPIVADDLRVFVPAHRLRKNKLVATEFMWKVPAVVVRVVDGDTIEIDLDLGWRVYRNREHIRLNGINAPERNTRKGKAAKAYAESRTVGTITIPGRGDFGALMVEGGHATAV